jgi:hypothetical protein
MNRANYSNVYRLPQHEEINIISIVKLIEEFTSGINQSINKVLIYILCENDNLIELKYDMISTKKRMLTSSSGYNCTYESTFPQYNHVNIDNIKNMINTVFQTENTPIILIGFHFITETEKYGAQYEMIKVFTKKRILS